MTGAGTGEEVGRSHRMGWWVGCVVVAVLLSYGVVDDLLTQVRLHHAQVGLAVARGQLTGTSRRLAAAERSLGATSATMAAKQVSSNQLSGELAAADQQLAQAKQGLELQNVNITTLDTCVSGVQQAVKDLQGGQQPNAIATIGGVAVPCQSLQGSGPGGPAYPFDFPDPDVIDVGGTYYAYATNFGGREHPDHRVE